MPKMSTADLYQHITDQVLAAIDRGVAPWRQPWTAVGSGPRNAATGKAYRGQNVLLLHPVLHEQYDSPFWVTFRQAKALDWSVRKGEKGTLGVFWTKTMGPVKDEGTGETVRKPIPLMRQYYLFNVDQCNGPADKPSKAMREHAARRGQAVDPVAEAEAIVAGYADKPSIQYGADVAAYIPALDVITAPARDQFTDTGDYYSTLFHEITHSTAHPSRLDRNIGGQFGSHDYAREELIAEMGSAFLCAEAGITSTVEASAAYLDHWRRVLAEDVRAVSVAAGAAQRAADHVLGRTFTEAEDTDEQTSAA